MNTEAHKDKMEWKAGQRAAWYAHNGNHIPPCVGINRHTGKPHEHKREIARNLGRV